MKQAKPPQAVIGDLLFLLSKIGFAFHHPSQYGFLINQSTSGCGYHKSSVKWPMILRELEVNIGFHMWRTTQVKIGSPLHLPKFKERHSPKFEGRHGVPCAPLPYMRDDDLNYYYLMCVLLCQVSCSAVYQTTRGLFYLDQVLWPLLHRELGHLRCLTGDSV